MSLESAHDQTATAIDDATPSEARSALLERAVAIGFLLVTSVAMIGWLYVLAVAVWNGASWLLS